MKSASFFPSSVFIKIGQKSAEPNQVLVFINYFQEIIEYLTCEIVAVESKITVLIPSDCNNLGFPVQTKFLIFVQKSQTNLELLNQDSSFQSQSIPNGGILIFQLDPSMPQLIPVFKFGKTTFRPVKHFDHIQVVQCESDETIPELLRYFEKNIYLLFRSFLHLMNQRFDFLFWLIQLVVYFYR